MKRLPALLLGLAVGSLGLGPLWADVIPTRPGKSDRASAEKVTRELVRKGLGHEEARRQVSQLTERDLAYFSSEPDRVQSGAGLLLEEWILGGIFAGAALWFYWWRIHEPNNR